jgi:hypothetical protein
MAEPLGELHIRWILLFSMGSRLRGADGQKGSAEQELALPVAFFDKQWRYNALLYQQHHQTNRRPAQSTIRSPSPSPSYIGSE